MGTQEKIVLRDHALDLDRAADFLGDLLRDSEIKTAGRARQAQAYIAQHRERAVELRRQAVGEAQRFHQGPG